MALQKEKGNPCASVSIPLSAAQERLQFGGNCVALQKEKGNPCASVSIPLSAAQERL